MKILIETIPHLEQRYNTCGDWLFDKNGDLVIHVSQMSSREREYAVALHELTEALLCRVIGTTQEEVDEFDKEYDGDGEPGDDIDSPYQTEHGLATAVERMFATVVGFNWTDYEAELDDLSQLYKEKEQNERPQPD